MTDGKPLTLKTLVAAFRQAGADPAARDRLNAAEVELVAKATPEEKYGYYVETLSDRARLTPEQANRKIESECGSRNLEDKIVHYEFTYPHYNLTEKLSEEREHELFEGIYAPFYHHGNRTPH